jgi:parafibromin
MGKSDKKPVGKPLILIPNAMTSPITMINAKEFFGSAKFIPRDVQLKNGVRKLPSVTFSRRIAGRLGGHMVEYEVMDNPTTRLKPHEWDRVVAVIPQGAAWQFKGWRYSNPVDIFNKSYGFYIGIEKTPIPKDLTGWRVKKGWLNRDKRSLDSVTHASFWNGYVYIYFKRITDPILSQCFVTVFAHFHPSDLTYHIFLFSFLLIGWMSGCLYISQSTFLPRITK